MAGSPPIRLLVGDPQVHGRVLGREPLRHNGQDIANRKSSASHGNPNSLESRCLDTGIFAAARLSVEEDLAKTYPSACAATSWDDFRRWLSEGVIEVRSHPDVFVHAKLYLTYGGAAADPDTRANPCNEIEAAGNINTAGSVDTDGSADSGGGIDSGDGAKPRAGTGTGSGSLVGSPVGPLGGLDANHGAGDRSETGGRIGFHTEPEFNLNTGADIGRRNPLWGTLGSANLSDAGLERNVELHAGFEPGLELDALTKWFSHHWAASSEHDLSPAWQEAIESSWAQPLAVAPSAEALWRASLARYLEQPERKRAALPRDLPVAPGEALYPHQEDAVRQALAVIDRYRGVLLADIVGF